MPEVLVPEAAPQGEVPDVADRLVGDRAPHAQREVPLVAQALEDARRAEPAVLVVDRTDAPRVREAHPHARRLDPFVLRGHDVAVAEAPGRLLAQHARRLAALVPLDDAAVDVEVAARGRERGRVQPDGVVVLRDQERRRLAGDLVERLLRRLGARRPVAVAPAVATQPAAGRDLGRGHARQGLLQRGAAVELHLPLRERPGREVDVGVGEGGQDAAPAEVHGLRRRQRPLVDADPARDAVAGDRQRPRRGSEESIVRMTPFSRITAASLEVASYRAATSLVQNMQRRASAGIELRHSGQSRTVSSTGGSVFIRSISAFTGLTTRK